MYNLNLSLLFAGLSVIYSCKCGRLSLHRKAMSDL